METKADLASFQEHLNKYGRQFDKILSVDESSEDSQNFKPRPPIKTIEEAMDLVVTILGLRSQHVVNLTNGSKEYIEVCARVYSLIEEMIKKNSDEYPLETFKHVALMTLSLAQAATIIDVKDISDAPHLKDAFQKISGIVARTLSRKLKPGMVITLIEDSQKNLGISLSELRKEQLKQVNLFIQRSQDSIRMLESGKNNPKLEMLGYLKMMGLDPEEEDKIELDEIKEAAKGYVKGYNLPSSPLSDEELALYITGEALPVVLENRQQLVTARDAVEKLKLEKATIAKTLEESSLQGALAWRDLKASRRADAFITIDTSDFKEDLRDVRRLLELAGAAGIDSALLSVIVDNVGTGGLISMSVKSAFIHSALSVTLTAPYSLVLQTINRQLIKGITTAIKPDKQEKISVYIADQFSTTEAGVTTVGDLVVHDAEHGATVASIIQTISPEADIIKFQGQVNQLMFETLTKHEGLIINLSLGPTLPGTEKKQENMFAAFATLCKTRVVCMALGNDGQILLKDETRLRETPYAIGGGNPGTLHFLKVFTQWASKYALKLEELNLILCANAKMDGQSPSDTTNLISKTHPLASNMIFITADAICSPANGQTSGGTSWAAPIASASAAQIASYIPNEKEHKAAMVMQTLVNSCSDAPEAFVLEGLEVGVFDPKLSGENLKKLL